jgi:hypothetical protein
LERKKKRPSHEIHALHKKKHDRLSGALLHYPDVQKWLISILYNFALTLF